MRTGDMKTVLGAIRRADEDFGLIGEGDRVAVGVSGGKDSLLLLYALSLYRNFCARRFELFAVTLTLGLYDMDTRPIGELCDEIGVPYVVKETDIGKVVFEERKEKNPCSLCAKMRRGALCDALNEMGCKKLALGHHRDDAIETLFLSMLYEGRIHTFHPKTYLSRSGITQIRPMVYVSEKHIIHMSRELALPVSKPQCPAAGDTKREDVRELIRSITKKYPNAREQLLSALQNEEQYGLWNK